jgi:hypothetical protein
MRKEKDKGAALVAAPFIKELLHGSLSESARLDNAADSCDLGYAAEP